MKWKFEKMTLNMVVKGFNSLTKLVLAVNALIKTLTVFLYKRVKNESLLLYSL